MERGLPSPSAALCIIGAALMEFERIEPGFMERLRVRIEDEAVRTAVVRLRGPKLTPEAIRAFQEAEAWIGAACLIADATVPKKRRKG